MLVIAAAFHAVTLQAADQNGTLISVPGVWETQADGAFAELDGFAWYRCYVKVPDRWTGGKRSLWSDSVAITVERVADCSEVYINGQLVGVAGEMPPKFERATEEVTRLKIPPGLLAAGRYNAISIRVYNDEGDGGFKGRAPIISGYYSECILQGEWQFFAGDVFDVDQLAASHYAVEERPAQAAFDSFSEATSTLQKPVDWNRGQQVSPADSLSKMQPMDGLVVDTVLAEPIVAQPLSMLFDERGRMWVVQYRQYPYPAGLNMVSRDKYYRAVYDKVPEPPPHGPRGADRVTIHEDTNGDGDFDSHKVFVDGLNIATSVARGRGGVWLLNPPYLLFYPDADNDDVPDSDPVAHLSGFGMEDTHSVVNNLRWGPDGWLYGAQGSTVSSHVKVVADDAAAESTAVYAEGAAIWRYHPETHQYERFAEGGGNAFCVEFDANGRLYSGHNGSDTRGFHYLQGGYYHKGSEGKQGGVSNLFAFGLLPDIKADTHISRFSHAFVKYEATALGDRFGGKLLSVDPLHQNVVVSDVEPDGSTFATKDRGFALESDDLTFRPIDIQVGPRGAVYVADMCEEFIAHGQHFLGQIDPDSGRIYRLRADEGHSGRARHVSFNLANASTEELVETLTHSDKWFRQTALRLIADRQDRSVVPKLHEMLANQSDSVSQEAFWALNLLGQLDDELALETLQHKNWSIRSWTVRLLGDRRDVSQPVAAALAALAKRETNVEVRAQLTCSARRLSAESAMPIVRELVQHDADADDPFIPQLLWWTLETLTTTDRESVIELFQDQEFWKTRLVNESLTQKMSRRLATSGTRSELLALARLFEIAPADDAQAKLMSGVEQAFQGRSLSGIPTELAAALTQAGGGSLSLRVRQGDPTAINEALNLLSSDEQTVSTRIELTRVFGEVDTPKAVPILLRWLRDNSQDRAEMQTAALAALQSYSDPQIANDVLNAYNDMVPSVQAVAQTLLASRKSSAKRTLEAVDQGRITKESIALNIVRRMMVHSDDEVSRLIEKHWPEVNDSSNAQIQHQLARAIEAVAAGDSNSYRGRQLYQKSCAKCHLLFGNGGRIGPDLTSMKRDDTSRMLLNIVNPSVEVREGFEQYLVLTDEGRAANGFLVDQDSNVVVLRGADGQNTTIRRDEIIEMARQQKSMMPEGLLDEFSGQQIRDLMAYLRQSQPISK